MEKSEDFEIDPEELFEQFKQVYQDFNDVLKNGSAGEKFSAVIKMDILSKTLKEFVETYNGGHDIPIEMINEAFEENKGEAFSRRLYRANERACEPLDKDMVMSMMKQVAKQVEERLHRKGKAHMDLKVDNVTISEDGKEFTVIDYPDEQELSGKKSPRATPVVGQLSHSHLLVESVAEHNIYMYADSGKFVERECSICDKERGSFTHMVSSFGHQALRETKYLPIGVDTIFNDTWAALYMAFVAFGAVEDEMEQTICQAKVFSLMKKMFADYISVYLRIHLGTIGKGEGFEARLKKEMNQRWPLGRAVKELELEVSVIKDQDKAFMQGLTK